MSFETSLFCRITFNRKTYNSIYDVESDIEDIKDSIDNIKNDILSLALITEPKKYCTEDEDTISYMTKRVKDNLDNLEELYLELNDLYHLKDNWKDCHNDKGLAIPLPDNIDYDSAFLEGDFIRTIKKQD